MDNVIRLSKFVKNLGIVTTVLFLIIVLVTFVTGNMGVAICFMPFVFLKWLYKKFYVTIYGRHGKVKKIELVRADKKYSTKYETMNGTVLEKLQEENNRFLRKCLGTPSKKSMTGVEYYYEWGQIQSFYDDRSCQTGIVIMF